MRKTAITRALLAAAMLTVLAVPLTAGADRPVASAVTPARQLITVTAASRTTSFATFRAYLVTSRKRVLVFGPWTARVGHNGTAPPGRKREGDGQTPSGSYGFSFLFGVARNPGVAFPYRHAYRS